MLNKKVKLKQLLLGYPSKLRYVTRYSTFHRTSPESVAEHSFYTALYSLLMGRALNLSSSDMGWLLSKALIHDCEENRSGDIPRNFKYSSKSLSLALSDAGESAFIQTFQNVVDEDEGRRLLGLWKNAKEEGLGFIVKFSDFLAVLAYVSQELRAGNREMLHLKPDIEKYYTEFLKPEYALLLPWIKDAKQLMRGAFNGTLFKIRS